MTPTQILEQALERINKGWAQRANYTDKDGKLIDPEYVKPDKYCSLGAIWYPLHSRSASKEPIDEFLEAERYLNFAIRKATSGQYINLVRYNDARDRHKEEIQSRFKEAIELSKGSDTDKS